jgi:putative endonuclease
MTVDAVPPESQPHRHARPCGEHPRISSCRQFSLYSACPAWLESKHRDQQAATMAGYVYIMTNRPNGTLYIGVTADLPRRIYEHREGLYKGFTKRYGLKMLVWYEAFDDIRDAIQRETSMKRWLRAYKVRAIMDMNPDWRDLYEDFA